jgi:phage-related protein
VSLSHGEDFVSIEFHRLSAASTRAYDGPYQGRLALGPEDLETIAETEGLAFSEVLTTLRSLSQNVGTMTNQVQTLTADVGALTTDFRALTNKLSQLTGEFTGSRWIIPTLAGVLIAVLGIILGMVWKR